MLLVASALTSSLFAAGVVGKTISVDVGKDGLVYDPDTIVAAVGDQVQFAFYPLSQVFAVDINDTNPVWLYCAQVGHCQAGMVAVINPPSGGDTLAAFKANAKNAMGGAVPGGVTGGSFVAPGSVAITYSGPSPQKLRAVRIAHCVLMTLSFLVLLPLGALSTRVFNFPSLAVSHATAQLASLTLVLPGFALGIYFLKTTHQSYGSQPHFILGTTVVAMLLLQPIFGFIHHSLFQKLGRKTFASYLHIWWGRVIFILALTNGALGLKLANSMFGDQKQAIIPYSVVAGIVGVLYIAVLVQVEMKGKT
ncbi:hypothetical protein FGG08_006736 [Glutinoglossum americanum]|uniref:Cytochrome b561 domain-containing protein n=1 Tax=Glutinoglossum americanum TaxID=1670608 RepID=A0A9P8I0W9_9PEZI|nr:hypothetical protein FGG08_006736 [Glutinoglossum americanum]